MMEEVVHRAVDRALLKAANRGDMGPLRSALAEGGDPNVRFDMRPLHFAVAGGHLSAIHALLEAGADLELRDGFDHTPLMQAVHMTAPLELYGRKVPYFGRDDARNAVERRALPIVVALIESGSDVDTSYKLVEGSEEERPLHWAVEYGRRRTVLTLLRAGASFETTERFELTFTGDEDPPPFSCEERGDARLYVRKLEAPGRKYFNPLRGKVELEIVSIDGESITAEFSKDDLDDFFVFCELDAQRGGPRPYRVGFFLRERHYSPESERNGSNKSTLALMKAIESAGSFDEYARRLQRDVHVAIITKCFQEKLPLDIKTALTTYLWKWGGA